MLQPDIIFTIISLPPALHFFSFERNCSSVRGYRVFRTSGFSALEVIFVLWESPGIYLFLMRGILLSQYISVSFSTYVSAIHYVASFVPSHGALLGSFFSAVNFENVYMSWFPQVALVLLW